MPDFADIKAADARALVYRYLDGAPVGGWLPPGLVAELLRCYGISLTSRVQPPIEDAATGGTEVVIGMADDRMFGPLVVFWLGGEHPGTTELLAHHAARLTPLTGSDADQLIESTRSARLLLGHCDIPAAGLGALRELLLRVSRLAGDLAEATDLNLSPVIAHPDRAFVVDARVKVMPYQPEDPYLRKLR